ncbi:MAG TPA: MBL fold metallo-hydrolase [Terriglobia bacterium]|nr:MBL fold metallo-hydrolase [Terriglobia bacterium]
MKYVAILLMTLTSFIQQRGQPAVPLVKENATQQISPHVYVIPDGNVGGVPNVGIVVGDKATLVIDTGLGLRNGQTVLREAEKVRKGPDLYVAATHFHSEHTLGEGAFPSTARVIRSRAEQRDMDEFGIQPNFGARSAASAELMQDAKLRAADELFDTEKVLDLGGVRVRMTWVGGKTHTNGDTIFFVEGDNVLFAGDIVMNRRYLAFGGAQSSVKMWIDALDRIIALHPVRIVPSHGEMGDGTLADADRAYLKGLQTRVAELKRDGKTADEAANTVTTEFRSKYPDWTGSATAAARSAYAEAP